MGGAEIQAHLLARELIRKGRDVYVVTRKHARGLKRREDLEGVPVYRVFSGFGAVGFIVTSFFFLLTRRDFDSLYICTLNSPSLLSVPLKILFPRKKIAVKIRRIGKGSTVEKLHSTPAGKVWFTLIGFFADYLIAASGEVQDYVVRRNPAKNIIVIPNGVDTRYFCPLPREEKEDKRTRMVPGKTFICVTAGRLIARKNSTTLLALWRTFSREKKDVMLLVLGTGPEKDIVRDSAEEGIKNNNVRFVGQVRRNEVREYFRIADVFVSASLGEGLSNAMLEALGCGTPVVALRSPGVQEVVVHDRTGYLCDNVRVFSASLDTLYAHRSSLNAMSVQARDFAVTHYSIERIAETFTQYL